jgi:hypothetical protein
MMKVGLWNLDHPEVGSGSVGKESRSGDVVRYLERTDCDVLILTEANSAIELAGYYTEFSEVSPFRSTRRFHDPPNSYHQVGIYRRRPLSDWRFLRRSTGCCARCPGQNESGQTHTSMPCAAQMASISTSPRPEIATVWIFSGLKRFMISREKNACPIRYIPSPPPLV